MACMPPWQVYCGICILTWLICQQWANRAKNHINHCQDVASQDIHCAHRQTDAWTQRCWRAERQTSRPGRQAHKQANRQCNRVTHDPVRVCIGNIKNWIFAHLTTRVAVLPGRQSWVQILHIIDTLQPVNQKDDCFAYASRAASAHLAMGVSQLLMQRHIAVLQLLHLPLQGLPGTLYCCQFDLGLAPTLLQLLLGLLAHLCQLLCCRCLQVCKAIGTSLPLLLPARQKHPLMRNSGCCCCCLHLVVVHSACPPAADGNFSTGLTLLPEQSIRISLGRSPTVHCCICCSGACLYASARSGITDSVNVLC